MPSEFDIIKKYFSRSVEQFPHISLAGGDDCALMDRTALLEGEQLAISTDMLVSGRHFFPDVNPLTLGHKSLAVNLSDLAAMGARPLGFTLALSLPDIDENWLAEFSDGMYELSERYSCPLIGGDTTKGPLTISITVMGAVSRDHAFLRHAAEVGEDLWVSGSLGDAALALAAINNEITLSADDLAHARIRLECPEPRLALAHELHGFAHAALDISDGLIGDLAHILERSNCGADIDLRSIPLGSTIKKNSVSIQNKFDYALAGGDDYELCFTANPRDRTRIVEAARKSHTRVSWIGQISNEPGLRIWEQEGVPYQSTRQAFDHFK